MFIASWNSTQVSAHWPRCYLHDKALNHEEGKASMFPENTSRLAQKELCPRKRKDTYPKNKSCTQNLQFEKLFSRNVLTDK